jgi:hypothetical protein
MAETSSAADAPSSVVFNYVKSKYFRVVYATGAFGGITPQGMIHACLYNERTAIPRRVRHTMDSEGRLSETFEVIETREGLVREMEIDLILDLATAKSLRNWLDKKIDQLTAAQNSTTTEPRS